MWEILAMQNHPESIPAIAERLVAIREAWPQPNQAAFARFLDLTTQKVNNYERAVARPAIEAAMAYVRKTGVTLDYIYRGERGGLPGIWLEKLAARDALISIQSRDDQTAPVAKQA